MLVFIALNGLAFAYQTDGKYDKAIKTYEESLALKMRCDDENLVEMSTSTYIERCCNVCFLILHIGIFERWKL